MNLNTELARLMGFFSPAAGPVSALSGEQAGGLSSPTAVIAQPPSPRSGAAVLLSAPAETRWRNALAWRLYEHDDPAIYRRGLCRLHRT